MLFFQSINKQPNLYVRSIHHHIIISVVLESALRARDGLCF